MMNSIIKFSYLSNIEDKVDLMKVEDNSNI